MQTVGPDWMTKARNRKRSGGGQWRHNFNKTTSIDFIY